MLRESESEREDESCRDEAGKRINCLSELVGMKWEYSYGIYGI